MKFEIKPYTLVLLVGPIRSGKSDFAHKLLQQFLAQDEALTGSILSVAALSKEVCGRLDLGAYDPLLDEAEEPAMDLLRAKLDAYMAPMTGQHLVIVDSLGLNEHFRKEMAQLARIKRYQSLAVVFDYDKMVFLQASAEEPIRRRIGTQAKAIKSKVLPCIRREGFHEVVRLHQPTDFTSELALRDVFERTRLDLPTSARFAVVGDVHEQADALDRLTSFIPMDVQLIQLGDYLDKNGNTAQVIEVMERLVAHRGMIVLHGNHENYVAARLTGQLEASEADEHFSSLAALQADKTLANRFLALWRQSRPFLRVAQPGRRTVWITHAPCAPEVLGKLTTFDLRDQRNLRIPGRTDVETLQVLAPLLQSAHTQGPWRVFGHIAHSGPARRFNQIWLDTGAAHAGGKLSAVIFDSATPQFVDVPVSSGISDARLSFEDFKS